MQAKDIKKTLKLLIQEASTIDPNLAKRLEEINRWIKDVKTGSLTANKFLSLFLRQIIADSQIWLDIQIISVPEEKETFYREMTPTEQYWFRELFPQWLKEKDPKFYIWRQKIMSGEFHQLDANLLNSVTNDIKTRGGSVVQRYIADLSMATDIIVSNRQSKALCIQITRVSDEYSLLKSEVWQETLHYWHIERGLFVSYNPSTNNFVHQIVNFVRYNSDNLKSGIYLKFSL